ncbi:MAG: malto-oligosyltrehalose trehalohydrolase [Leptolyngbyaceae cyanobacterium SL_5_9]|nr:malto-oligosyltrehalose trehalohydrolase [Leptolyngbyaceae cyanobacterium SL_5_9]NJO74388.1 malto-oligosyltrehalose trehalohydrolase [Leptolyngbyaceae cyanobacterium RM1_406_9]
MKIGARYLDGNRCEFTLWAPLLDQVAVKLVAPTEKSLPMQPGEHGYWQVTADDIQPGTRYFYDLGECDRPDPASQFQPEGVHGPSEVVDHQAFSWTDQDWSGVPLDEMVIYELHVGTFTPEGTFEAIAPRLRQLKELGINAIEIMPVAQFPGDRNWGYDGVYPFAVQHSYGEPDGLKQLVNICHQEGFAVILDVVYNHFGPEGNYTSNFAPFFTETYKTPWGSAINFDDAYSQGVRNYFIENALYWFEQYRFDALRLDAIHAIYDLGAKHFLRELADDVAALSKQIGRKLYLIAESDLNDVRVIQEPETGGHGMDAQWSDDFHHCLHTLLTGEQIGYYRDFGTCGQLAKAYKNSFVYDWQYSAERKRYHGSDASDRPGYQFVVCTQNHDQVGNRMLGDRLSTLVSFEALKLAAGALLLSPNIPMLFMGEEYGEESPFLYFVSHTDPDLVEAVRAGRKREFAAFHLEGEYSDPQSPETFKQSQLKWEQQNEGKHKALRNLYQHLIHLRQTIPALKNLDKQNLEATVQEEKKLLFLHRWQDSSKLFCILNFNNEEVGFSANLPNGDWQKILDSAESKWMGAGSALPDRFSQSDSPLTISAQSFAVYQA